MMEELPEMSPDGAAIIFVLGRLIVLLDRHTCLSVETVAADLERYTDSVPEDARGLVSNLAKALRPARLTIVPSGDAA